MKRTLATLAAAATTAALITIPTTPADAYQRHGRVRIAAAMQAFNSDMPPDKQEAVLTRLEARGVHRIRVNFNRAVMQPLPPTASSNGYNPDMVTRVRILMGKARSHHIRILAVATTTPAWAGPASNKAPTNLGLYRRYIAWVARWERVIGVEIGNEWNLPDKWADTLPNYVRMLKAGYLGVQDASRPGHNPAVIVGGVASNDANAINRFYQTTGRMHARRFWDKVAVHPYTRQQDPAIIPAPGDEQHYFLGLRQVLQVMHKYGDTRPLAITEFGWHTYLGDARPAAPGVITPVQRRYTATAFRILNGGGHWNPIRQIDKVVYVYQVVDTDVADRTANGRFGWFTRGMPGKGGMRPKPIAAWVGRYMHR